LNWKALWAFSGNLERTTAVVWTLITAMTVITHLQECFSFRRSGVPGTDGGLIGGGVTV
jgi:hypothetical protein